MNFVTFQSVPYIAHVDTGVLCDEVINYLLQINQIKSMVQCACVCLYASVYGRVRMLASVFLHAFICVCVYKDRDPTFLNLVDDAPCQNFD